MSRSQMMWKLKSFRLKFQTDLQLWKIWVLIWTSVGLGKVYIRENIKHLSQ